MASRKPPATYDELLGAFTERIAQTVRRPNIYRYGAMPHQELFHQCDTKGRILFGGNRAGKTYAGTADDVMILTRRHPYRSHLYPDEGPIRMRFIGVDFERGIEQTALPLFAELIPPSFLANGSWEDSYRAASHMLTLADKSTVSFMSYEQDANKFQSVSLHHIHFDEEPPKQIFDESMLRLVDVGGSWTLSETPVQQLEWVEDELIQPSLEGIRPDVKVFYLDTRDNVNLPPEELIALEASLTPEERVIRLEGKYKGGSLVFPEFTRKAPYVIDVQDFVLTDEWAVYESMDYGYANPTAWLWTAVHPDGSIITFRSLYSKSIVVSEWAAIVLSMRKEIARQYDLTDEEFGEMLAATVGDPSINQENGQTGLSVQQAYAMGGVYIGIEGIVQARSGNQNVGLDKMHTYLRLRPDRHEKAGIPWWQITATNTALIDEVKKARKPKQTYANEQIKNASEQIRDKDNHAIDAIKYLFIITHDLRPEHYREVDDAAFRQLGLALGAAPVPAQRHPDVYAAMMSGSSTSWDIHGASGSDYRSLEE